MSKHSVNAMLQRNRQVIYSRRKRLHPFVPQSGRPDLCAHCNAGPDDTYRDRIIHTI